MSAGVLSECSGASLASPGFLVLLPGAWGQQGVFGDAVIGMMYADPLCPFASVT
jgi:hypothetical protein